MYFTLHYKNIETLFFGTVTKLNKCTSYPSLLDTILQETFSELFFKLCIRNEKKDVKKKKSVNIIIG